MPYLILGPTTVGNLRALTSLDLKENRLKELPPEIGYLKNLRELMIDSNKLNALPAEFDEIEDTIEHFTYDNNPFSSKLLNFDEDDLDEGDVRYPCLLQTMIMEDIIMLNLSFYRRKR